MKERKKGRNSISPPVQVARVDEDVSIISLDFAQTRPQRRESTIEDKASLSVSLRRRRTEEGEDGSSVLGHPSRIKLGGRLNHRWASSFSFGSKKRARECSHLPTILCKKKPRNFPVDWSSNEPRRAMIHDDLSKSIFSNFLLNNLFLYLYICISNSGEINSFR